MDDKNVTNDVNDQAVDAANATAEENAKEDVVGQTPVAPESPDASAPVVSEDPAVEETVVEQPQGEAPQNETVPPAVSSGGSLGTDQQGRQLHAAKCSTCGKDIQVPFQPAEGRPVYCKEDFMKMRNAQ